jgi:hypothetical protein
VTVPVIMLMRRMVVRAMMVLGVMVSAMMMFIMIVLVVAVIVLVRGHAQPIADLKDVTLSRCRHHAVVVPAKAGT